jgi:hypothetical protein
MDVDIFHVDKAQKGMRKLKKKKKKTMSLSPTYQGDNSLFFCFNFMFFLVQFTSSFMLKLFNYDNALIIYIYIYREREREREVISS